MTDSNNKPHVVAFINFAVKVRHKPVIKRKKDRAVYENEVGHMH